MEITDISKIWFYLDLLGYVCHFYVLLFHNDHHHHHHDVRLARIYLTLSLHVSLSFIAFGRSSGLHPVSSHSCYMNVRAGRPAFDWPYAGVHRSTSLMISSLLLQQCLACLVRLACIVFVIGGRWPYSWCRVGCCCQDLFNIACNILNNSRKLICFVCFFLFFFVFLFNPLQVFHAIMLFKSMVQL